MYLITLDHHTTEEVHRMLCLFFPSFATTTSWREHTFTFCANFVNDVSSIKTVEIEVQPELNFFRR